ncbi:MAG TPA: hypothetical protein VKH81_08860 [Candidatus Angelobacter sp.]|nr:hypothetical protein [Candidatus Angelobacter sp.]
MKILDRIFAWLLLLLGCIHCVAAFLVHKTLTLDVIWFVSGGLAQIFGALLNLVRAARPEDRLVVRVSLLANLLLFAVFAIAVPWLLRNDIRQNPQVIALGVAVAAELFFSLKLSLAK